MQQASHVEAKEAGAVKRAQCCMQRPVCRPDRPSLRPGAGAYRMYI